MLKQHHSILKRKKAMREFYDLLKKRYENMELKQICALYSFISGTKSNTVQDYLDVMVDAGIVKLNSGKIVEIIDLKKKEET